MDPTTRLLGIVNVVLFLIVLLWPVTSLLRKRKAEENRRGGETASQTPGQDRNQAGDQSSRRKPVRSEAITLLATLQREARFVDFIKEPLDGYSDAQIGAAVRDVHRDCGKVLDRLFAIRAMVDQEEGSPVEVPAGFDAGRYRLTGNVAGDPPFHGRLVHHGWEAAEVQLPAWSGTQACRPRRRARGSGVGMKCMGTAPCSRVGVPKRSQERLLQKD